MSSPFHKGGPRGIFVATLTNFLLLLLLTTWLSI